jgi:hypothetical protein
LNVRAALFSLFKRLAPTLTAMWVAAALASLGLSQTALKEGSGIPPGLYVEDPDRPYAMAPNVSLVIDEGVPYTVRTNERGYRDAPWTFDHAFRVLMLGDGMTTGAGGPREQGFVALAEQALASLDVRIFNAAVGGYGLFENLATLRRECPIVTPHLVLNMHWYDDILPVKTAPGAMAASSDRSWPIRIARLEDLRAWLSSHGWHPTQLLERLVGLERLGEERLSRYMRTRQDKFQDPATLATAARAVAQMRGVAARCGAGFRLVVLPTYAEALYGLREPATELLLRLIDPSLVVDLRERLPRGTRLTSGVDGHYDAHGNRIIADVLASILSQQLSLRQTPDGEAPPK